MGCSLFPTPLKHVRTNILVDWAEWPQEGGACAAEDRVAGCVQKLPFAIDFWGCQGGLVRVLSLEGLHQLLNALPVLWGSGNAALQWLNGFQELDIEKGA